MDLVGHPRFCSDGYHFCKVKDMLELEPYLVVAIAPAASRTKFSAADSLRPRERLSFVDRSKYRNLWSWSHKAYEVAKEYDKHWSQ